MNLTIDYQDRELNRVTTFFRIFTLIPIAIILAFFAAGPMASPDATAYLGGAAGLIVIPTALMIIFERKYPRWWFDFNKQLVAFILRFTVYMLVIDDRYPSTDEEQGVHVTLEYPNVDAELDRYMPIVKWLLAIPHYIVLFFLGIGVLFATIFAWFSVLFTGRYPQDIFEFVEGTMRWHLRVLGYAALMVTDEYPPFRLSP